MTYGNIDDAPMLMLRYCDKNRMLMIAKGSRYAEQYDDIITKIMKSLQSFTLLKI